MSAVASSPLYQAEMKKKTRPEMRGRGYAIGEMLAVVVGVAGLGMCAAFLTTHATPLAFGGRLLQQQQRAGLGRQITMLNAANAETRPRPINYLFLIHN